MLRRDPDSRACFVKSAGYPDAEWQIVFSCNALGDPDAVQLGNTPRQPDEPNEFNLLKNGLHIVLGFESRVHSDLDANHFVPVVRGGARYVPLNIKFARFMADMKTGKAIQKAWLQQMASDWYWRREGRRDSNGNEIALAYREIPRIIACNLGSLSAEAEALPIGNAPRKIAADIAPGQRTHVYQARNAIGGFRFNPAGSPYRPPEYIISATSPWPPW